ncbi:hypothetical protein CAPTEDRAFT_220480 [Capitella teleta]|uniref:Tyrosine-protein kinase ephrin type A/B receptor-like domain-containing protein n=1 Tax=Capitella teleta TaxID=283909 RepID=R7U9C9_CAPTE|nr:hypothetical protein CAPTEDRAFT_220480 [Capitella teleta]|eukprot:ELU02589.1 hypothetical protein CAPTEDRAFT_220480 [Capitella teleta]
MVIKFVMKTMEASTTKCANLCENHINNDCLRNCENTTIQQAKGSLLLAANQVQDILKQPTSESIHGNALVSRPLNQAPVITVAGVNLTRSQAVHIHPTQTQCPSGMMKRDHVCVECPAGTHLPSNGTQCVQCPRGTHQANPRQTSCLPCVTSPTKTSRIGATSCDQTIELILRPGILSRIAP